MEMSKILQNVRIKCKKKKDRKGFKAEMKGE